MATRSNRRTFNLWHKRIGILSALVVLMLSITGMMLNHTDDLGLDHRYISSPLLLRMYGIKQPELHASHVDNKWFLQLGRQVWVNQQAIQECDSRLIGAVKIEQMYILVCQMRLALYTLDLQLIESVGVRHGLPQMIEKLGVCDNHLCLFSAGETWLVDLDTMNWTSSDGLAFDSVRWVTLATPPKRLADEARRHYLGEHINVERLLLDIHAGRFMGGAWVMDVFALAFILLALSGMYLWFVSGWRNARY